MKQGTTQKELAQILGLTQATISLCFSQPEKVADETRRRVMEAARRYGYRPNLSARAMRNRRTDAIAVIESHLGYENSPAIDIIRGAADKANEVGRQLVFTRTATATFRSADRVQKFLLQLLADGVLMNFNVDVVPGVRDLLDAYWLPTIWMNSHLESDCVYPDDYQATFDLTRHLIALGHRRIIYVDVPVGPVVHYSRRERQRGYLGALMDAGLPGELVEIKTSSTTLDDEITRVARLMAGPPRVTAVVGYSMRPIFVCIRAATEVLGWKVPQQLSLAVTETEEEFIGLRVTTAVNPFFELGRVAVELLVQKCENPSVLLPPRKIPFRIHWGDSCVPPGEAEQSL
ncbi:MAG: LacI family transcriptional regulator [Lentisphaerae bacterium]|nr:MAG: LacI family transcriptional regulator [Lentisphaerota bacterium]